VWIASRKGNRKYCDFDHGYRYGSGISDLDYIRNNVVIDNNFINYRLTNG